MEKKIGKVVETFRTYRGGEYCSNNFGTNCTKEGIPTTKDDGTDIPTEWGGRTDELDHN